MRFLKVSKQASTFRAKFHAQNSIDEKLLDFLARNDQKPLLEPLLVD
jgi:hypothetical protein